ncbi:hypothetical protein LTR95_011431 [Oleoguttula sp. CCFEE 5521]
MVQSLSDIVPKACDEADQSGWNAGGGRIGKRDSYTGIASFGRNRGDCTSKRLPNKRWQCCTSCKGPSPPPGSDTVSAVAPPQYPSGGNEGQATVRDTQATTPDSPSSTLETHSTTAVQNVQTRTDLPGSITAPSGSASVTSVVVSDTSSVTISEPSSTAQPDLTTAEAISSSTSSLPSTNPTVYPTMAGSSGAEKGAEYSEAAVVGLTVMLVVIVG